MKFFQLVSFTALITAEQCSAKLGGLLSESISSLDATQVQCLKSISQNLSVLVVPISAANVNVHADKLPIFNATRNLANIRTDVLFHPNPQLDARKQVDEMTGRILDTTRAGCLADTVWIAAIDSRKDNSSDVTWFGTGKKNRKMNRQFIDDVASYLHALSSDISKNASCNPFKVGIYTDFDNWKLLTNNCTWIYKRWFATKPYDMPLWFVGDNDLENMNDYVQIGGWNIPDRKQFSSLVMEVCGAKLQLNFQE